MACLFPLKVINPRYRRYFKAQRTILGIDNFIPPEQVMVMNGFSSGGLPFDFMLVVPCGKCSECLKRKAKDWQIRLLYEKRFSAKVSWFVTLTIAPEYYDEFVSRPQKLIRMFLEDYRLYTGKSLRHWIVTELGDNGRLHFHGIFFDPLISYVPMHLLWRFGISDLQPCKSEAISYVVKYILKPQEPQFSWYTPIICASPGLGKAYVDRLISKKYHLQNQGVNVCNIDGFKYSLPRYYRLKLIPDDLRMSEQLLRYYEPKIKPYRINGLQYNDWFVYDKVRKGIYEDSLQRHMSISPFKHYGELLPDDAFDIKYTEIKLLTLF